MPTPTIRPATDADRPAVEALLTGDGLPLDGVADHLVDFLVAEEDDTPGAPHVLAGVIGLERYGDVALLRSAAVAPAHRGAGLGRRLVEAIEARARAAGVRDVVLLTTTADRWFPRFGYVAATRDEVPAAVRASAEFRGACPDSAAVMRKGLYTRTEDFELTTENCRLQGRRWFERGP